MSPIRPIPSAKGEGAASPPDDLGFLPIPSLSKSVRAARLARVHKFCTAVGLYIMLMSAGAGLGEICSHLPILAAIPAWFAAMALIFHTLLHLHDKSVL